MTYQQTIDWMFKQLPMYQSKGKKAFSAKLNGIKALVNHLSNPHYTFKSIHVAGTNGKGSSSHMLASILQEAGYKVGLYTSPHLKDFRERIRVNGIVISKTAVVDFISANKAFLEDNKLSFFEMTVGMAFDYFAKQEVDIAIVETGLGGRLDSTNIINPQISLITNIGLDHTEILGDTLVKIAFEKAGIIKEKVPVVISEYNEDTIDVFKSQSKEKNTKLVIAEHQDYASYDTDLLGGYQKKNIKGVLGVVHQLNGFHITEKNIKDGLLKVSKNTGLLGRWQQIGVQPTIICDTAHNYEGLSLVMHQLREQDYHRLHMVLGFVKEKELSRILPLFPKYAAYYFCKPGIARGMDEMYLMHKAQEFGLIGTVYESVNKAFNAAKNKASKNDLIYVGGSTFVVAEIL